MRLRKRMNSWWRWRAMHWPITVPSRTLSAANGAVERLDLRLLVDRQHEAVGRRIEIQPDHIAQLGGKGGILGQLEAPYPVRLQAVRCPDPLHRAQRDARP